MCRKLLKVALLSKPLNSAWKVVLEALQSAFYLNRLKVLWIVLYLIMWSELSFALARKNCVFKFSCGAIWVNDQRCNSRKLCYSRIKKWRNLKIDLKMKKFTITQHTNNKDKIWCIVFFIWSRKNEQLTNRDWSDETLTQKNSHSTSIHCHVNKHMCGK